MVEKIERWEKDFYFLFLMGALFVVVFVVVVMIVVVDDRSS
jgi:hypothetical protein